MTTSPPIWCAGGAHVDHIGRAAGPLSAAGSTPGAARGGFGGVALNVARALAAAGRDVTLAGAAGDDPAGRALRRHLAALGIGDRLLTAPEGTGAYVAVEDAAGEPVAAVADARGLEGLAPGALAAALAARPAGAALLIDANLAPAQIDACLSAGGPGFRAAEAVSEAKAPRLGPRLAALDALFCNLGEARALLAAPVADAAAAAAALAARGPRAVFVTDGPRPAACAAGGRISRAAPRPAPGGPTGSGDAFVAALLDHLTRGGDPHDGLAAGHEAARRLGAPA